MAKMASTSFCVALVMVVLVLNANLRQIQSAVILVGDNNGWTNVGENYVTWAANVTIRVNDTLGTSAPEPSEIPNWYTCSLMQPEFWSGVGCFAHKTFVMFSEILMHDWSRSGDMNFKKSVCRFIGANPFYMHVRYKVSHKEIIRTQFSSLVICSS